MFVTAADGSRQRQITPFAAGVEHPHWSPDGRWVIYDVESQANPKNGVYLVRPNGHGAHRILRSTEKLIFFKPDFSPDGKRIVLGCYVVVRDQDDICTTNSRGRDLRRIVSTADQYENFPIWSN